MSEVEVQTKSVPYGAKASGEGLYSAPPTQGTRTIRIPDNVPVYRVLSEKGFFGPNDTLYEEGSIIILKGVPNEDMEPLNELARKNLDAYLDVLEESSKLVASHNGRAFLGRPRTKEDMLANASEDARKIQSINGQGEGRPLMGGNKGKKVGEVLRLGDPEPVPVTGRKTPERDVVKLA